MGIVTFFYYLEKWNQGTSKLVIQCTTKRKKYSFSNASQPLFLPNGNNCLFIVNDTLNNLTLSSGELSKRGGIRSYNVIGSQKSFLVYEQKDKTEKVWVIENILTSKKLFLNGVDSYLFGKKENYAILVKNGGKEIDLFDLLTGKQKLIWKGHDDEMVFSTVFNKKSEKFGFGVRCRNKSSIWVYNHLKRTAKLKVTDGMDWIPSGRRIGRRLSFSKDGKYIYFVLANEVADKTYNTEKVKISIWSFRDNILGKEASSSSVDHNWYAINDKSGKIICVTGSGEDILTQPTDLNGFMVVTRNVKSRYWEGHRHNSNKAIDELVNLENGTRTTIPFLPGVREYSVSPDGDYLFIWAGQKGQERAYSFSLNSRRLLPIGSGLESNLFADESQEGLNRVWIGGWIPEEHAVIIYDRFDIWRLDLNGKTEPLNLTGGYGRNNSTKLRISDIGNNERILRKGQRLLLNAFNTENKDNGFYQLNLDDNPKLDSLTMRAWISDVGQEMGIILPIADHLTSHGFSPKKASNKNLWLVFGKSASNAPNFYITKDFKNFERLTNYQPHKGFIWYTSTLEEWYNIDGKKVQGILYRPTNFDPNKKYPVIVSQYRMLSQLKNEYFIPKLLDDAWINIPWFVNRGYLVLLPDIYLTEGGSGKASLKVVESAVAWLSKEPYINSNKIGLAGHSQAGFQANYISANTNVLACVLAGAGGADWLSSAFRGNFLEESERRNGLPWESDIYTESALFKANRTNTPLLLFHCPKDDAVPFKFSVDYFTALWRMNKPVWLLEYVKGGHALTNYEDTKDFTTRVEQFFGHYLKDTIAPVWMTQSSTSYHKSTDMGLQSDLEGSKTLPSNPYLKN